MLLFASNVILRIIGMHKLGSATKVFLNVRRALTIILNKANAFYVRMLFHIVMNVR